MIAGFPADLRDTYEPLEELGAGAMGRVIRCRDLRLGREVALKLSMPGRLPAADERFVREGKALASVRHPGVVAVYDAGRCRDGGLYLVMELLRGEPLDLGVLLPDPLSMLLPVAEALEAVHRAGLLHRDVKPANLVMTEDGRVVLVDFGLTQDLRGTRITRPGMVAGTPAYMAPEVLAGTPAWPGSDWYSWGATLFELAEQRIPFGPEQALARAQGKPVPFPSPLASGPRLVEIFRATLDADPEKRLRDLEQLRGILQEPEAPSTTAARSSTPDPARTQAQAPAGGSDATRAAPGPRPWWAPAAAGALALVLLGFVLGPRGPAPEPGPGPAEATAPGAATPAPLSLAEATRLLEEAARPLATLAPERPGVFRLVPWTDDEREGWTAARDEDLAALRRHWASFVEALLAWLTRLEALDPGGRGAVWGSPPVLRALEQAVYGQGLQVLEDVAGIHVQRIVQFSRNPGNLTQMSALGDYQKFQRDFPPTCADLEANLRVLWDGGVPPALRAFHLYLSVLTESGPPVGAAELGDLPPGLEGLAAFHLVRAQLVLLSWSTLRFEMSPEAARQGLDRIGTRILEGIPGLSDRQRLKLVARALAEEVRAGRRGILGAPLRGEALTAELEAAAARHPQLVAEAVDWVVHRIFEATTVIYYGPQGEPEGMRPLMARLGRIPRGATGPREPLGSRPRAP